MIPFSLLTKLRRHWMTLALPIALVLGGLMLFVSQTSSDTKFVVVNTQDDEDNRDGDCSLREAIKAANAGSPVDTCEAGSQSDSIVVPAGRYKMSAQQPLHIRRELTLIGAGPERTIIEIDDLQRNGIESAFEVTSTHFSVSGISIYRGSELRGPDGGLD